MTRTVAELCDVLQQHGLSPEIEGDGAAQIAGAATLDEAGAGHVSFLSNPRYEKALQKTAATAVVLKPGITAPDHFVRIRVADPYAAITVLIVTLHGYRKHHPPVTRVVNGALIAESARIGADCSIHPGATIADDAVVGARAVIYPGCYVGPRCRLGDDVVLFPNVVVYDDSIIGDRVTLHAGTVIGEDGLGYAPVDGKWLKIPQIGIVELGDDVELGACCTIDRATLGRTVIASGTKFSNLIAIGHGSQIGEHCMFVAQVGIAGSVTIRDRVTLAGQVGVAGHLEIGAGATVGAKAGVTNNVPPGETYLGQPAIPITDAKRRVLQLARLPDLSKKLRAMEKRIAELEARANTTN